MLLAVGAEGDRKGNEKESKELTKGNV